MRDVLLCQGVRDGEERARADRKARMCALPPKTDVQRLRRVDGEPQACSKARSLFFAAFVLVQVRR